MSQPAISYDDKQLNAREVTWLCCRHTVFATNPNMGCLTCRAGKT